MSMADRLMLWGSSVLIGLLGGFLIGRFVLWRRDRREEDQ